MATASNGGVTPFDGDGALVAASGDVIDAAGGYFTPTDDRNGGCVPPGVQAAVVSHIRR
jgi:hypothetical protein